MEIRSTHGVQAQGRKVSGYAAVFNKFADLGEFHEQIAPGAFRDALATGKNIRALYDHDSKAVLGTTQAGTLELREDERGLAFTLELPDTTTGRDVAELVKRGDVAGCSFGFRVAPNGEHWEQRNGKTIRTLMNVELAEITLTSSPAYPDTALALRSRDARAVIRCTRAAWLETCL